MHPQHHHPGDPVEDDVEAGHQGMGRIEPLQVGGLLRPSQGREGPEPRGEPGVEDVLVLSQGRLGTVVGGGGGPSFSFALLHEDSAVGSVPGRDPVAPPELARDAPGLDVPHPLEVGLRPGGGFQDGAAVLDRGDGRLGQGGGVHEPLVGEVGLDDDTGAVAVRNHMAGRVDAAQQFQGLELGDHLLAGDKAVEAAIGLGCGIADAAEVVEDVDHLQAVALADLEVVEVMGRGDFHRPRPLLGIGVVVGDDGDQAADDGQPDLLAHQVGIALVLGVHRHGGVTQHGFGPGRGHDDLARAILQRVGEAPEMAIDLALLNLQVGDGGLEVGVPVHQPLVAIEQALLVEGDEDLADGGAEPLVQGEALAAPVAGGTQPAQLAGDGPAALGLPGPDPLKEGLAPHVAPAKIALGSQLALDHHLGSDAGVIRPGQPEGRLAPHALEPDQHVLQGVVQGVADVQRARHIGRRYDHGEGFGRRILGRREGT